MATLPLEHSGFAQMVSVQQYLATSYEPDCEYDEGCVVERNVGEFEHSFLQAIFAALFTNKMEEWGVFGLTEQRVQIATRKFRLPDVCVLRLDAQKDDILTEPPLIVLEILSPQDTVREAARKAAEYLEFGIENVWVIDPQARVGYVGGAKGLEASANGELMVPGTAIRIKLADVFARLDQIRARR